MTIIDTTSDTLTSQSIEEEINRPTGKVARSPSSSLSAAHCGSQPPRLRDPGASQWCHVTFPHGNTFRIVADPIRFSARFRCADRSSSSVLLSSEREDGCGACAKLRSERFCTGSTPYSVARRSTNAAELIWPSVEIESPNRFQWYLGFVPSTSSSRLLVCGPAHSSTRLSSGSVGTVLIRLCGRDVLRVPISSSWRPSPDRRHPGVISSAGPPRPYNHATLALTPGTRLGVYEITAQIGEGGMGQVYRATDTTLGRQVAIKILPDAFAADPERLARFEREAKTLASLNHPHIAAIYGFEKSGGTHALVMELVEGEDLSQRIARGADPARRGAADRQADRRGARSRARAGHHPPRPEARQHQGAARRHGEGARLRAGQGDGAGGAVRRRASSKSPTITTPAMTQAGMILGTAAYMSPEQATGKPVDKRADIWAFGVVLCEMLTGRRAVRRRERVPYAGRRAARRDRLQPAARRNAAARFESLLRRCLDRDSKTRLRDIGEARVALQRYLVDPAGARAASAAPAAPARKPMLTAVALGVAAIAMAVSAGLAWVHFREQPPVTAPVRFEMPAPAGAPFSSTGVLSPDGRSVAFDAPGPDGPRSCGCARSMSSTRGPWQEPRG